MKKLEFSCIKFSLIEGVYWASWVPFFMYFTNYMDDLGISISTMSLIILISTLFGMAGNVFWGRFCDKHGTIKKVLLFIIVFVNVMVFFILHMKTALTIGVLYAILMFNFASTSSLIDTWAIRYSESTYKSYGIIRGTGSICYSITAFFFGRAIYAFGVSAMLVGYLAFSAVLFALVLSTKDISIHVTEQRYIKVKPASWLYVFKTRKTLFFFAAIILLFVSNLFVPSYMPLIVKDLGLPVYVVGIGFFFTAISEAPLFVIVNKLAKKIKIEYIMLVSSMFFVFRPLHLYVISSEIGLYMNGFLQGLSFAPFYCCVRYYIKNNFADGIQVTMQNVAGACMNLSTIILTVLITLISRNNEINAIYLAIAAVGAIGVVMVGLFTLEGKRT